MKAVVIHAARDLRVEERDPETPGPGQVEVAIEAGGICGSDLHYSRPRDRGHNQGDRQRRVEIRRR